MTGTAVSVNPHLVRVVEYNIGVFVFFNESSMIDLLTIQSVLEPVSAVVWNVSKMVLLLALLLIALKLAWPRILSLVKIELKEQ